MNRVRPHLRYLRYVWRHKRHVYAAGVRLGVPRWRLVVHDWSKLLPNEWMPYVARFGNNTDKPRTYENQSPEFERALVRHVHIHPHHWQHWVMAEADGDVTVVAMPDTYAREMVADWCGAGAAQGTGSNPLPWYRRNRDAMTLHPDTRTLVDHLVGWSLADGSQP